jgi:hypothetical protein
MSIGVPIAGRKGMCVACSADLELQLGCMLPRELSRSFETTGQWLGVIML